MHQAGIGMVRSSTYTDIIWRRWRSPPRWGNVAKSYFIRKKKGYFHFPAIKHANKHIAEVNSEAGILVLAATRELPIHRVRHAIASS
jgi:hypothetical protein